MFEGQPHKAAFMNLIREDRDAVHFLMGYLVGHIDDELLCKAIQSYRGHEARLADLEERQEPLTKSEFYDPRD
jgi:hypothetical protein